MRKNREIMVFILKTVEKLQLWVLKDVWISRHNMHNEWNKGLQCFIYCVNCFWLPEKSALRILITWSPEITITNFTYHVSYTTITMLNAHIAFWKTH